MPRVADQISPPPSPRIVRAATVFVLSLTASAVIDRAWPGSFPPATLTVNVIHLAAPLALCGSLWLLLAHRRRRDALLVAAASAALAIPLVPPKGSEPPTAPPSHRLRVMTANLGAGLSEGDGALSELRASSYDVVLLQEVGRHHESGLRVALSDVFPHQRWHALGRRGKAILSRWPIASERLVESGRVTRQEARIVYEEQSLTLLNTQLSARAAWRGRHADGFGSIETFARGAVAAEERCILVGDWNTAPWGGLMRRLADVGFVDAFAEIGLGPGFTFPVRGRYRRLPIPPIIRLDHILAGPQVRVTAAAIGPDLGSDHYPVVAELVW